MRTHLNLDAAPEAHASGRFFAAARELDVEDILMTLEVPYCESPVEVFGSHERSWTERNGDAFAYHAYGVLAVQDRIRLKYFPAPIAGIDRDTRIVHEIHFAPTVKAAADDGQEQLVVTDEPVPGQRTVVMAQLLAGTLGYVVGVEAAIIPRPDVVNSATNPTMARLAERLGFVTINTYIASELYPVSETFRSLTVDEQQDLLQKCESPLEWWYSLAKLQYQAGNAEGAIAIVEAVNELIEAGLPENEADFLVPFGSRYIFAAYETFRSRAISFAQETYPLISKRLARVGDVNMPA